MEQTFLINKLTTGTGYIDAQYDDPGSHAEGVESLLESC